MTHQQALAGLASERYLLDEMTEVERFEFEAHYFDCAECAEDVRLGEMIRQEARRAGPAMAVGDVPARPAVVLTSPKWWRRPMVAAPWAVAATLALVAGYQSLVTVPALRNTIGSEALSPVMLRGATRGATPVVRVAPNQRFVTVAADVMAETGASTSYDLLDSTQAVVAQGEAQAPAPGVPLMLLIPVDELRGPGRYVLIIRAADHATVINEYEFEVSY